MHPNTFLFHLICLYTQNKAPRPTVDTETHKIHARKQNDTV